MRCDLPATRDQVAARATFLGVVYQAYYLVPELNVLENVVLSARIARIFDQSLLDRAHELLQQMGVGKKHFKFPGNYQEERDKSGNCQGLYLIGPRYYWQTSRPGI